MLQGRGELHWKTKRTCQTGILTLSILLATFYAMNPKVYIMYILFMHATYVLPRKLCFIKCRRKKNLSSYDALTVHLLL